MSIEFIQTDISPKNGRWEISVMETEECKLDIIKEWCEENISGKVFWRRTQFRNPKIDSKFQNPKQNHFSGGLWMMTFWFSKKNSAAIFHLWWYKKIKH